MLQVTHTTYQIVVFTTTCANIRSCTRIINIWNSLPNSIADVDSLNLHKARLDKLWMRQGVRFYFTADAAANARDRSVMEASLNHNWQCDIASAASRRRIELN